MRKVEIQWVFIVLILLLSFLVRLYRINRPLADWHSWRQVDTASVTRFYVSNGIDLMHPRYLDLSNIPSGKENPRGYRMVEFPYINAMIASIYKVTGGFSLPIHVFSRYVSIVFSLGSILALFMVVKKILTPKIAIISAAIFAFLPFNIFYHTTVLPEVPLVFLTLLAVLLWIYYVEERRYYWLISFAFIAGLALLLKPIFVFVTPALAYYLLKRNGWKSLLRIEIILTSILVIVPFLGWRYWIGQYPEGIPASSWLFNGNGIRFKGAWFRWLFADRFGRLILGYWGVFLMGLGTISRPQKKGVWFFHWWLFGMIAYLAVFATGNVTHDYYQIFIIPIVAVFMAIGINELTDIKMKQFSPIISIPMAIIVCCFTFAFSWYHIRDYFNINNPAVVEAGQAVDRLTPKESLVIAPYMGDTAFLYQTNRSGWPIGGQIQQRMLQGAKYYVSTTYDEESRYLESRCDVLEKTANYIVIDLQKCSEKLN